MFFGVILRHASDIYTTRGYSDDGIKSNAYSFSDMKDVKAVGSHLAHYRDMAEGRPSDVCCAIMIVCAESTVPPPTPIH